MSAIATIHRPSKRRPHLLAAHTPTPVRAESRPEARWSPLVVRLAVAADDSSLRRLAHLDSARPLAGQTLIAEQGGALVAAISLEDGRAIADPFVSTAVILAMLALRAEQLERPAALAAA